MGSSCCPGSGTPNPNPPQMTLGSEDKFIIENNLDSISLQNTYIYFWVDLKISASQNQKYLNTLGALLKIRGLNSIEKLMSQMKNIDSFARCKLVCAASLKDEQFQILQDDFRIEAVYLFCQNKQRAAYLVKNYPKVKQPFYTFDSLREFMANEKTSQNNPSLLFLEQDHIKIMNKSRVNFYCLTNSKLHQKAKDDFLSFARKFYPSQTNQIRNFQLNYKLDLDKQAKNKQTLGWLSKSGFFYDSIHQLPKITLDPKKLAYIRFPFNEAYSCIYQLNKANKNKLEEAFVVIIPSQTQIEKLNKSKNNFVMFTSFMKGWTSEKKARKILKKNQKSIMIRILFSSAEYKGELDYGYCIVNGNEEEQDILFNIYNLFEIKQVELEMKEVTLQYGSLAEVTRYRQNEREVKMSVHQNNLVKNYYYLQDVFSKIQTQAPILQMSGHFKDSLSVCLDETRLSQSQPGEQQLDKNFIKLGDAYALNENFQEAEQSYNFIRSQRMKLIANLHLANLYLKTNKNEKLEQVLSQINKNISLYQGLNKADLFAAQNYVGLDLMNKGEYKKASVLYKKLISEMREFYDFKYEGIPLVHEILRNKAACETKLLNYEDALNLLNSTVQWQIACEGIKSPGLIVTENLIRSLHDSRGDKEKAQECDQRMKNIYLGCTNSESLYETRRAVVPTINQSAIKIATTGVK